ncbi:MAG TPA: S-formylglutathione hydrolase [Pseudomonadales bacterium]|nr:S-formylglutathione hydrolase [Pseudomonadales bacterium]
MEIIERNRCFDGEQLRIKHNSQVLSCEMIFALYLPPQATTKKVPLLWWLSGLTCNDQNFVTKAGSQRIAAELGIAIIAPDTSPRGDDVADDENKAWDFGLGAGFYVNATQAPFSKHYRMYDYVQSELPALVAKEFADNIDVTRQSISGHSMGGHGALTLAIRHPAQYKSVSAFAPIVAPMQCPWGEKAFSGYLGADKALWAEHDTCALITARGFDKPILVDQGLADSFLVNQLKPELLEDTCTKAGVALTLNRREGYDHSYYFIATFFENHLRHHAQFL